VNTTFNLSQKPQAVHFAAHHWSLSTCCSTVALTSVSCVLAMTAAV